MSDFGGISIAYSALQAHRKRIDVIGENIANVDTPGYHRQQVLLSPLDNRAHGLFSGLSGRGGGVSVEDVVRVRDEVLESHARVQSGIAAERRTMADALVQLEQIVGGLDDGGLHAQMSNLFNSFDDLASSPDDVAIRQVVLQRAETVAQGFTRTASTIDAFRDRSLDVADDVVRSINVLSDKIAVLDAEILGSVNVDADPNALLDQRDALVGELGSLAHVDVVENPNGQVTISLDGQLLVSNGASSALSVQPQADATLGPLGYDRITVVNEYGRELRISGGELAGHLLAVNQTLPDGKAALDVVAVGLVNQVNTIHQAGLGLDSSTGLDLFTAGPGPGEIQLSTDVAGQAEKIAAAGPGAGVLDNTNARDMAALADAVDGPLGLFSEMVGSLAARAATANASADASDAASTQATNLAMASGGVSLDEELTDLITAQRSYEAAARLMTTIDEMLQTLVNSTGLVGR